MRYMQRPVQVEAMRLTHDNLHEVAAFVNGIAIQNRVQGYDGVAEITQVRMATPTGQRIIDEGKVVVKSGAASEIKLLAYEDFLVEYDPIDITVDGDPVEGYEHVPEAQTTIDEQIETSESAAVTV